MRQPPNAEIPIKVHVESGSALHARSSVHNSSKNAHGISSPKCSKCQDLTDSDMLTLCSLHLGQLADRCAEKGSPREHWLPWDP